MVITATSYRLRNSLRAGSETRNSMVTGLQDRARGESGRAHRPRRFAGLGDHVRRGGRSVAAIGNSFIGFPILGDDAPGAQACRHFGESVLALY
jgi:hypothetical protein